MLFLIFYALKINSQLNNSGRIIRMATLSSYSALIRAKGLDNLLGSYMNKPLSWFQDRKQDISQVFYEEMGSERAGDITRMVWDIINPNFGTGVDEGHVKDATYVAIIFEVLKGNDKLLRNTFTRSIANVNSRIASVGRVIGTATIRSKLVGGRRKTRKNRRGAKKTRKNNRKTRR
jgi:hypothetical protein